MTALEIVSAMAKGAIGGAIAVVILAFILYLVERKR